MTQRGKTRAIVLAYLRDERGVGQMRRYMQERHGISAGALHTQLCRMVEAGVVERTARGRYRRTHVETDNAA